MPQPHEITNYPSAAAHYGAQSAPANARRPVSSGPTERRSVARPADKRDIRLLRRELRRNRSLASRREYENLRSGHVELVSKSWSSPWLDT